MLIVLPRFVSGSYGIIVLKEYPIIKYCCCNFQLDKHGYHGNSIACKNHLTLSFDFVELNKEVNEP